jgi:ABC-2 type transporter
MFLALAVAEALALMVSHLVPHFIIGIALAAGLYGFFMLFQGFMIVPSAMPSWLEWVNSVAFHTYSWRSFMYIEFKGNSTMYEGPFPTGPDVLAFYEIADVSVGDDMVVLACYAAIVHCLSCIILQMRYNLFRGHLEPLSRGFSLQPVKAAATVEVAPMRLEPTSPKMMMLFEDDEISDA